jgi:uracil-DNA glycosylase
MAQSLERLALEARSCALCAADLPLGPRPVFQVDERARVLIAAQAPGTKVHASGRPFTDASGDRLRDWMGIDAETFYDASQVAILPIGFCYPGCGKSGDLPPRKECAVEWRQRFIDRLANVQMTLVIGQYAMAWHLQDRKQRNLTETVKNWSAYGPEIFPLPHPSPRNNIWLKKNPWFNHDLLPDLRKGVRSTLA